MFSYVFAQYNVVKLRTLCHLGMRGELVHEFIKRPIFFR